MHSWALQPEQRDWCLLQVSRWILSADNNTALLCKIFHGWTAKPRSLHSNTHSETGVEARYKTLADIQSLIRKTFHNFKFIHVVVAKEGSVTVICYAPHYIMGTLVQMAKESKSMLLENSVSSQYRIHCCTRQYCWELVLHEKWEWYQCFISDQDTWPDTREHSTTAETNSTTAETNSTTRWVCWLDGVEKLTLMYNCRALPTLSNMYSGTHEDDEMSSVWDSECQQESCHRASTPVSEWVFWVERTWHLLFSHSKILHRCCVIVYWQNSSTNLQ